MYELDEANNPLKHEYYRQGKLMQVISFLYKYDKKGNWIERIEFWDSKPIAIKTRTITYFN